MEGLETGRGRKRDGTRDGEEFVPFTGEEATRKDFSEKLPGIWRSTVTFLFCFQMWLSSLGPLDGRESILILMHGRIVVVHKVPDRAVTPSSNPYDNVGRNTSGFHRP